jgi:hypothetical protein
LVKALQASNGIIIAAPRINQDVSVNDSEGHAIVPIPILESRAPTQCYPPFRPDHATCR